MPQMATQTEVEGETTVNMPPEFEAGLAAEQADNDIAPQTGQNKTAPAQVEETNPEPTQESQAQVPDEDAGEVAVTDREERRVSKLIPKLKGETEARKKAEAEASSLRQLLDSMRDGAETSALTNPQAQSFQPPWEKPSVPTLPQGEVTPEQLQQFVASQADQIASLRVTQAVSTLNQANSLERDIEVVRSEYDVLNPKSENYSPEKEQTIAKLYATAAKADPKLKFKNFVDDVMSLYQAGQTSGQQQATQTVAKQYAEGAVPPTVSGQSKGDPKSFEDMSPKEMEDYLRSTGEWDKA